MTPYPLDPPHNAYTLIQATPEMLDEAVALITEVSQWLLARGIDQWSADVGEQRRSYFIESITLGELFMVVETESGQIVGMLELIWEDEPVWGHFPDHLDAGYIHSFAIRRTAAGHGLGRAILRWAEEQVAARGLRWLRLDCLATNTALCRYYEAAGFTPCGQVRRWQLYQRAVDRPA